MIDTTRFPSDDALPHRDTYGAPLVAFHEQHATHGTFDPLTLIGRGDQ